MRIHRDERGQTIILVALSLPLLLGFVGIATDVGALFKVKRTMQTAADAGRYRRRPEPHQLATSAPPGLPPQPTVIPTAATASA